MTDAPEGGAVERSREFMDMAKATLLEDKSHATIAFLFSDAQPPVPVLAEYGNDTEKQHFYDEALRSLVRHEGAYGVLVIAEAWSGRPGGLRGGARWPDCCVDHAFTKRFPRRITLGEADWGYHEEDGLDDVLWQLYERRGSTDRFLALARAQRLAFAAASEPRGWLSRSRFAGHGHRTPRAGRERTGSRDVHRSGGTLVIAAWRPERREHRPWLGAALEAMMPGWGWEEREVNVVGGWR